MKWTTSSFMCLGTSSMSFHSLREGWSRTGSKDERISPLTSQLDVCPTVRLFGLSANATPRRGPGVAHGLGRAATFSTRLARPRCVDAARRKPSESLARNGRHSRMELLHARLRLGHRDDLDIRPHLVDALRSACRCSYFTLSVCRDMELAFDFA